MTNKCDKIWDVTLDKCEEKKLTKRWNATRDEISQNMKCYLTTTNTFFFVLFIKHEMSQKMKYHKQWNVTKDKLWNKFKCDKRWNMAIDEVWPMMKWDQKCNVTKVKKLQKNCWAKIT